MAEQQNEAEFVIEKIFTSDISFESPNTPAVFNNDWQPEANIDLNTASEKLSDDTHEVKLTLTITAKSGENTTFVVEIVQNGIFTIRGIDDDAQVAHLLGAYCPSTLFPYAREVISNLVNRGGFPQLNLAPINFDALYAQSQSESEQQSNTQH